VDWVTGKGPVKSMGAELRLPRSVAALPVIVTSPSTLTMVAVLMVGDGAAMLLNTPTPRRATEVLVSSEAVDSVRPKRAHWTSASVAVARADCT